jgi:hypothetical protein
LDTGNWRSLLEDLRQRRPELAKRACRRLLTDMQRRGMIGFDDIDQKLALQLQHNGFSSTLASKATDPNRPKPMLPGSSQALYDLALKHAEENLSSHEIAETILLTEKRQLAFEVSRLAEIPDTPFSLLHDKVNEFRKLVTGEAVMPPEDLIGTRAALVRRLLTDQLDFIGAAKHFIKVVDIGHVMDHIIPTEGNQGRLGGKAAGLILARSVLMQAKEKGELSCDFKVPVSYYIPSNGTLDFVQYNGLEEMINVKYRPIDEVRAEYPLVEKLFKSASFPPTLHEGLRTMLEKCCDVPLVIRSSSLLEDRIGHAFSGKYKSLFIPNRGSIEKRMADIEDAIAEVYASIFHPDPIEYRRERGLIDFQEAMGILIQEVVGQEVGETFLPAFAGVAFSRCEMRWSPRIQRTDGMARLVLGLGTRAVDRTADDYPVLVALDQPTLKAVQRPDEVYRYSQSKVDVIDLKGSQFDSIPLPELMSRVGRKLPMLGKIFSLYREAQILPMIGVMAQLDPNELVVTFDALLRSGFPRELKQILDLLEEALGEPVDVELAHDGTTLHVVQCRALTQGQAVQRVPLPHVQHRDIIFTANRYVQMGQLYNLEYLVLIDPRDYERLPSQEAMQRVSRTVGAINRTLPEKRFILMGPGRWGSRGDIRLGVPVTYADICRTSMLVEIARKKGSYLPDVSFGTHFFQDLVEAGINYLPLYPDDEVSEWHESFLNDTPNCLAEVTPKYADMAEVVKVIHIPEVAQGRLLHVIMDSEVDQAVAFLGEAKQG